MNRKSIDGRKSGLAAAGQALAGVDGDERRRNRLDVAVQRVPGIKMAPCQDRKQCFQETVAVQATVPVTVPL